MALRFEAQSYNSQDIAIRFCKYHFFRLKLLAKYIINECLDVIATYLFSQVFAICYLNTGQSHTFFLSDFIYKFSLIRCVKPLHSSN